MTDKPILFSGPMVRAILEGRKTQTRRALKPQPCPTSLFVQTAAGTTYDAGKGRPFGHVSYAPGDRLWVRENHSWPASWDADNPVSKMGHIWYPAGRPALGRVSDYPKPADHGKVRSSRYMPRWASRLTLTVTDVRVQRLQEISERDARAEGCEDEPMYPELGTTVHAFRDLWDSLNAKPKPVGGKITTHYVSYPWAGEQRTETHRGKPHHIYPNPWVSATTFTAHRCNIDQMGGA